MKKKNILAISLVAALTVAAGVLWVWNERLSADKPSKKAPQVPINNPGEQSEFTSAASESEIG